MTMSVKKKLLFMGEVLTASSALMSESVIEGKKDFIAPDTSEPPDKVSLVVALMKMLDWHNSQM